MHPAAVLQGWCMLAGMQGVQAWPQGCACCLWLTDHSQSRAVAAAAQGLSHGLPHAGTYTQAEQSLLMMPTHLLRCLCR